MPTSKGHTSHLFKACVLIATVIVVAALSSPNPAPLSASITASLVDKLGLAPGATGQSTPITQSTADVPALTPADKTPARTEIAASELTNQSQTENREEQSEALFRQFQAWAAEKAAQEDVAPPVQPVQDAPSTVVRNDLPLAENTGAPVQLVRKHRHVRPTVNNAQSETPIQNPRKPLRLVQNARAQVAPAKRVRTREPEKQ